MRIFLSGGGTMGSVTPLIALTQELKRQCSDTHFLWIGTRGGPERQCVEELGIPFYSVHAGKWRRYVSWTNIVDPFFILLGFFQSIFFIIRHRPAVIVSAGSFVSVPLIWAGWLLRVPCSIHQQDIRLGLANKLMQPFAKKITVVFEEQLTLFPSGKTVWTGNPVREEILQGDRVKAMQLFDLEKGIPTVLVTGGGTGAEFLNELVAESLSELTKFCQVIHLTGRDKAILISGLHPNDPNNSEHSDRYHAYAFLTQDIPHALAVADLVVCRAGMGTLTELAALGKPAIVIPMPDTHQEDNAAFFTQHNAVVATDQRTLVPSAFVILVQELLKDQVKQDSLKENILKLMPGSVATKIAQEITALCSKN